MGCSIMSLMLAAELAMGGEGEEEAARAAGEGEAAPAAAAAAEGTALLRETGTASVLGTCAGKMGLGVGLELDTDIFATLCETGVTPAGLGIEAAEPLAEAADAEVVTVVDEEVAEEAKAFAASGCGCCSTTVFLPRFAMSAALVPPCPAAVVLSFALPPVCAFRVCTGLAVPMGDTPVPPEFCELLTLWLLTVTLGALPMATLPLTSGPVFGPPKDTLPLASCIVLGLPQGTLPLANGTVLGLFAFVLEMGTARPELPPVLAFT